ncbi:aminotransferase class I/II-fold pyridoxal phosphate-dependent enzyme [Nocardia sp. ET3-3]|uniref:Aminotransferase class I/II-fold pyridoxal phosphate-dependent enzyme n=2 Tax=Nocardia terrae TaxID=2675851 RepID=A0A7K1UUT1_9NOCA|nr:aminotransferase class I/II-fold pyridoxal phosphate-dependent enzyme [Nocardia terrae]
MFSPGDVIAVDELTYPGFKLLARAHDLELAPIPARADGPDLDRLARICAERPVRAVYTMPTLHNPLGWVLDDARRRALVSLARRHDLRPIAHPRSFFAWLLVDPDQRMDRVAAELSRRGIRVCTAADFATTAHVPHGLRIALGSTAPEELPAVLAELRAALGRVPL